jgi:serine/threonine protein kinase
VGWSIYQKKGSGIYICSIQIDLPCPSPILFFTTSLQIIHADLAARNVLINSSLQAKVSDFGLSKKLYESSNYTKKSKVRSLLIIGKDRLKLARQLSSKYFL